MVANFLSIPFKMEGEISETTNEIEVRMFQEKESAKEYLQHSKQFRYKICQSLINLISVKPTDNVFEIGCGTGEFSAYLATEVLKNGKIIGCDPEESRINVAREKFSDIANLSYVLERAPQALQNATNLYDVVFSSNVLHWMSNEELELTTERQFIAMKPGAMAAHLFLMSITENLTQLISLFDDDLKAEFHALFKPIPSQWMVELAERCGFEVKTDELHIVTEFASVDEYLTLIDATLYGKFGFKGKYHKFQEKVKLEKITEDGRLIQSDTVAVVILKKP